MAWLLAAAALALIVVVLVDAFEVMILPRRVAHGFRPARTYYRAAWRAWRFGARFFRPGKWRFGFLGVFGPLSLFGLLAIWATGLISGFALLYWSLDIDLAFAHGAPSSFGAYLYFSGTTFFTLGYGDFVPSGALGRALSIVEAGIGFGFLALVISYLPVLYQAFSRREVAISLLDARAGSPPSAGELLRRLGEPKGTAVLGPLLADWERWAAELLESHLSYPVLSYYRSQHDNQSWIAALTAILDTSALLIASKDSALNRQARLAFAMARHAAVDLCLVFKTPPRPPSAPRLPAETLAALREAAQAAGLELSEEPATAATLHELRGLYEPFVFALATHFQFDMPSFVPQKEPVDNWRTSAWTERSPDLGGLAAPSAEDGGHFT